MTLDEFREHYNYAPYELYEFAEAAIKITGCEELSETAKNYLASRDAFKGVLDFYEIGIG
jgi:hypothetical protein